MKSPLLSSYKVNGVATIACCMVVFASLIRGGNRAVSLLALELMALCAIIVIAWRARCSQKFGGVTAHKVNGGFGVWWILFLSPLWLLATQLLLGDRISNPVALLFSFLAGIPISVLLYLSLSANEIAFRVLWRLWLWFALAQSAFGLFQLTGFESLYFGMPPIEPVVGTFASKNTYANILVMAIPLTVWQWICAMQGNKHGARRAAWGWGAAVFTLVVTVMLTTSRAGIATGLIALLLSAALLPARKPGAPAWRRWWPLAAAVLLLGAALAAGGLDWAVRFDADRLERDYDLRAVMRAATAQGALANLPFGTGLGSFPWVSSAVQPPEMGFYWFDLAHNDYLQLLMETGVVGAALIALVFGLYVRRWVALWRWGAAATVRRGGWPREQRAAVACGIGLLAFALHAWVDYPFHIPANAMMAATLLGLMCRPSTSESNQK